MISAISFTQMKRHDKKEGRRLQRVARDSWYSKGIAPQTILYSGEIFCRHLKKDSAVLELGPAEGAMTAILLKRTKDLTVVEGAPEFCKILRRRFPRLRIEESLFENFKPSRRYDVIVMGHVLEHVADPSLVLKLASKWLSRGGRIMAAVPNASSVHRQAAVLMGLIPSVYHLNASDIHHGHRRVFDPVSFKGVFKSAKLRVDVFGGYWLKPLSNAQIEQTWTPAMLHAFMRLGEKHPDIAAEIYVVASLSKRS